MSDTGDPQGAPSVEIAVSDLSELRSLRGWLERVPDVQVEQVAGIPGPGEQGAVDVLVLLVGSSGMLAVAIRTLPEFIRSRRSTLALTLKTGDKEVTLSADNINQVMPVIEKFFDD
ncbi:hypothetical protein ABZU75_28445 [Streptosporangium sp. NPDC005286]|uniref:effector-associated constant component EACC1 n=1 Tax=Streptosporangium sp. NPDC005286 TaxID=3154463 RepID=UPI0033A2ECB6